MTQEAELERTFPGDSEMARRMRAVDWSRSTLGPSDRWPENLRVAVSICLTSRFPTLLWWGPRFAVLYNDAYIPFLGPKKHPRLLGAPGHECWAEIWDTIGPMLEGVRSTGVATWSEDTQFFFARELPREEVFVRFTYGPLLGSDGHSVDGIFTPCTETTEQVVGARRLETLRKLGAPSPEARTPEAACAEAAAAIAENPYDLPCVALYVADEAGATAHLAATAGLPEHHPLPLTVSVGAGSDERWPLGAVLRTGRPEELSDLSLPGGAWPEPATRALVLPLSAESHAQRQLGFVVAGISPRRVWNAGYRTFMDVAARQIGSALATARSYETERRRAESLAELDRAKTVFFSNVSHELRTPLTLMLGPIEEALENLEGPRAEQEERLQTAHRNAVRLLKLVNSLLDFSRLEAGRIQASYEPTDLGALTTELASSFRSLVERAGLRLELDCPPLAQPAFVDRQMWEKIVLNLLSNAFKFTFEGTIGVKLTTDERAWHLTVRDTGTGIEPRHLPHVFERFYRVEGARGRTYGGSGIGLALVRELARLHGGSVSVESTPGEGSTFTVTVPVGSAHLPPDRIRATRTQVSTAVAADSVVAEAAGWTDQRSTSPADTSSDAPPRDRTGHPTHLLVADDNADMRAYLERLLRPLGTVELVSDGQHALAAIERRLPDLLLSDVMMPKLDGLALVRELRRDHRTLTLPIVLLSARAGEDSRVEGAQVGADDFIVKPFAARELVARVRVQLQLARQRREHTEALREAEKKYRELVRLAPAGLYELDFRTRRFTSVNDAMTEILGYSREELLAMTPFDILDGESQARFRQRLTGWLGGEKPEADIEYKVRTKDGRVLDVLLAVSFTRDQNGNPLGATAVAYDITERKRTEEALRESREALRAANDRLREVDRRKNEFLAVLSHELRNPLAPIANSLYILDHASPGGEQGERAKQVIGRQVAQLSGLVNDLLDVTRITRNKIQLQKERLELGEIVRRAVEDNRSLFDRAGVHLEVAPALRPAPVIADRTRVAQIVGNLLQNSAKFTTRGGHTRVAVAVEGREAVVRVTDDGVGIPRETIERLFQPFMQAEQALDRSKGGLGLGLALVKGLVELHGGAVAARSEGLGHGTEMTVRLPLDVGARLETGATRASVARARRRVLIIEDNADAADSLSEALGFGGHEVAVTYNGPEGLAKARELRPDVVLCDIGLPGMDGYEVARAFRVDETLRGTFLVALSGYALPDDLQRAAEAGFQRHLAKPPSLEKLEQLLAEVPHLPAGRAPDASAPPPA